MKDFERVQVESTAELRAWLADNYSRTESIWLVTYKKNVPEKYVSWDEVVEEALCFGWIDSLPRKLDADRTMVLLSPRRAGNPWSGLNKRRVEKLSAEGRMASAGLAAIEQARADGSWEVYDEIEALVVPPDLAAALAEDRQARPHFEGFSPTTKKGILWWIKSAKTDATRQKRIAGTAALAALNLPLNSPEGQAYLRQQQKKK